MIWKPIKDPPQEFVQDVLKGKYAKFLVDESLGPEVTKVLRAYGCNVKDVSEVNLRGKDDGTVRAWAFKHKRFILTHDVGFLDRRKHPWDQYFGVIVLPGGAGGDSILLRALGEMLSLIERFSDIYQGCRIELKEDGSMTILRRDQNGIEIKQRYRFPKNGKAEVWED